MDRRPRLLVVDDQHEFREILAASLQDEGYRVDLFDAGTRALEYLEHGGPRPDVIVLDLFLKSDVDGWAFAERVKANPALRDIPIVAMTAASLDPVRVRQLKAELLVPKPFDLQTLLEALKRIRRVSLPPPNEAGSPGCSARRSCT